MKIKRTRKDSALKDFVNESYKNLNAKVKS